MDVVAGSKGTGKGDNKNNGEYGDSGSYRE
jgi:hypothetical protein